jgi:GTP pyrophosphokinase
MIRINEIIDRLSDSMSEADLDLIRKAYVFSATAHAGQTRLSGEPYLSHPLEAANILAELRLDAATVAAGLLHDTVEDTKATIDEIEEDFGEEVADIVDGVTKISQISFESKEEPSREHPQDDPGHGRGHPGGPGQAGRRLHNMRTLDFQKPEKQALIAQETMDIYAPLANRLGLHRVKIELEDLSFKYLKPEIYAQIRDGLNRHHTLGEAYIERVIGQISELLKKNGITGRIFGRKKHFFSIFNKMRQQDLSLDQVHDLIAFRVIVEGLKDCYAVLGLVHSIWKPVPGRFKDYISMPKANMYQSLHTTVIGPDGERIEIQIRTEEMNRWPRKAWPPTGNTRNAARAASARRTSTASRGCGRSWTGNASSRTRASSWPPCASTCSRTRSTCSPPRDRSRSCPRGPRPWISPT